MSLPRPGRADLAAIAACFLAGLVAAPAIGDSLPEIRQHKTTFSAREVAVARAERLRFTNEDPFVHHLFVEHPNFTFDSGEQRPGQTVAIVFDRSGIFTVQCAIHLKMRLVVTVR